MRKPGDAAVEPEAQDLVERVAHLVVPPVQIGLRRQELVAGSTGRSPRRTSTRLPAERHHPVVRRRAVGLRVGPHVPVAVRASRATTSRRRTTDAGRSCGWARGRASPGCRARPPRRRARRASASVPSVGVDAAVVGDVVAPVVVRRDVIGSARCRRHRATARWSRCSVMPRRSPDRRRSCRRTSADRSGTGPRIRHHEPRSPRSFAPLINDPIPLPSGSLCSHDARDRRRPRDRRALRPRGCRGALGTGGARRGRSGLAAVDLARNVRREGAVRTHPARRGARARGLPGGRTRRGHPGACRPPSR